MDPAPVVAAVLDALPAFEADGSDDSERGGDDEFNDMCEVPASEAAEMMGWDTYYDEPLAPRPGGAGGWTACSAVSRVGRYTRI